MQDFENQVVLVTGAAGSLGSTVARMFLQRKAHLVLVDRAQDRMRQLFPELDQTQAHQLATGVDLTKPEEVNRAVDQALDRFKKIDVLLNIAGMYRGGFPVAETSLDLWQQLIAVNAQSVLLTSQAVALGMKERGSGRIINVAARPGLKAGAGNAAYAVSKSAVLRLTESLSAELKERGVNVNAVIPGTIDTEDNRESMPEADHDRWVDPAAIGEVMLFLASNSARAIHGAAIPVYGLS